MIVRIWRTGIDRSESYRATAAALGATGILRGEQAVELLEVHGGEPPR